MDANTLKVNEMFESIQGEGRDVGRPAFFVRTAGCNLNCDFCDTKYALKKGDALSVDDVYNAIVGSGLKYVVFTGGEPLIQKNFAYFCWELSIKLGCREYTFALESNGSFFDSQIPGRFNPIVISPKLDFLNHPYIQSLKNWGCHAIFKFVVRNAQDVIRARHLVDMCNPRYVVFQPEGNTRESQDVYHVKKVVDWVWEYCPAGQVVPRLHSILFDGKRGV